MPGLLAGWLRDVRRAKEKERERARARGMRERASVRACDCKREARERGAVGNSGNRDEWGGGRGCYDEAKEPEWVARRNWPKTCALPDFALAFVLLCILSVAALLPCCVL